MRYIHRRIYGVTLLEVMVVVGSIAILASLAAPVVLSSKSRANVASCMTRLRQVGLAIRLYESDNERIPNDLGQLANYAKDDVTECPYPSDRNHPSYHFPTVPTGMSLVPGPGSVIAYCMQHLKWLDVDGSAQAEGNANVVRYDMSAQSVDARRVEKRQVPGEAHGFTPTMLDYFPGEPWPPQYEPS